MTTTNATFLLKGARLGRYEVIRLLGAGGMGAIYEAVHVDLKKTVALKTLHPEFVQQPQARQRFVREGEAAARIRHPHVVDITDMGEADDVPYLVMEYLRGRDLRARLQDGGPLPVGEAMGLLVPICAALAVGHDAGVIHRDLKPQNIFLSPGPGGATVAKLLDFGISKLREGGAPLTGTAAVLGTLGYMSPEQARGSRQVDERGDQYGMGLVLYETLTGTPAQQADSLLELLQQIVEGRIRPPRELRPEIPPELEAVILRCLAPAPEARHRDMRVLGRALLPFAPSWAREAWSSSFASGEPAATLPLPFPTLPGAAASSQPLPVRPAPSGPTLTPSAPEKVSQATMPRHSRVGWLVPVLSVGAIAAVAALVSSRRQEPSPKFENGAPIAQPAPPPLRAAAGVAPAALPPALTAVGRPDAGLSPTTTSASSTASSPSRSPGRRGLHGAKPLRAASRNDVTAVPGSPAAVPAPPAAMPPSPAIADRPGSSKPRLGANRSPIIGE